MRRLTPKDIVYIRVRIGSEHADVVVLTLTAKTLAAVADAACSKDSSLSPPLVVRFNGATLTNDRQLAHCLPEVDAEADQALVVCPEPEVWLSYIWGDRTATGKYDMQELVKCIAAELKRRNLSVWMDIERGIDSVPLMNGDTLEKIADAVHRCQIFVPVVTPQYQVSPNCKLEFNYAAALQKSIVPVYAADNKELRADAIQMVTSPLIQAQFGIIFAHCRTSLDFTSHPDWGNQMSILKREILAKLNYPIEDPVMKWYGDDIAPWGRSKIMMIGEGGSGKTSTVRSFLGEDFVPEHLSTVGGDVSKSCSVFFKESISASGWTVETTNNDLLVQMAKVESKKHYGGGSNGEFLSGILKDHTGKAEVVPNISDSTPMAVSPRQTPADSIFLNSIEEPVMTVREFENSLVAQVDATSEEKITMSLWDFGGQEVFYSMHHSFLTAKGVYCLCFRLTDLCEPYATDDTVERCLKYLKFWLISVRMHAESAPIFLVGTHKDKLPPNY
ncbi:hypothetical protein HDU84_008260, partial [Entophlyctis sp. JEL0112]